MSSSEADAKQRGGAHYKDVPPELQHWNVVAALDWDYYIGSATKYLWRLGKKDDPVVELGKAIHFLEKKRELLLAEREAKKSKEQLERITSPIAETAKAVSEELRKGPKSWIPVNNEKDF